MLFTDINQQNSDLNTDTNSVSSLDSLTPFDNFEELIAEINNLNIDRNMTTLKKEYLDMIPEFHGDSKLLSRFIEICEKLLTKFFNKTDPNDFQNEYLLSTILSKIKGDAAVNLSSCTLSSWACIKNALINSYADKRDCYTLGIELTELKQNNETPFDYFNKIQDLLNLQIAYITLNKSSTEAPILAEHCRKYALRVLLRGLKEPLGTLMRTKNPQDMNSALHMLTNDFQLESYSRIHNKTHITQPQNPHKFNNLPNRQTQQYTPQLIYRPNLHPNNPMPKPFNQFQIPKQNVFKPNPNATFPKPTPMSISTRQSFLPRPGPSNYNNQYRPQHSHNLNDLDLTNNCITQN